jgi:hypothetical protein
MARPPIHPGEVLADELAELQISAAQLGRELHVPTNRSRPLLMTVGDQEVPNAEWTYCQFQPDLTQAVSTDVPDRLVSSHQRERYGDPCIRSSRPG